MVKVQLVPNGDGQSVVVHGTFRIGSLIPRPPQDSDRMVIQIGVDVKKALREILKLNVPTEEVGDWDSTLAEYVNMCILERIGVRMSPIVQEQDGTLSGFAGEYELVEGGVR